MPKRRKIARYSRNTLQGPRTSRFANNHNTNNADSEDSTDEILVRRAQQSRIQTLVDTQNRYNSDSEDSTDDDIPLARVQPSRNTSMIPRDNTFNTDSRESITEDVTGHPNSSVPTGVVRDNNIIEDSEDSTDDIPILRVSCPRIIMHDDDLPSTSGSAIGTIVNLSPTICLESDSDDSELVPQSASQSDDVTATPQSSMQLEIVNEQIIDKKEPPTKDASTSPMCTVGRFIACEENDDEGIICIICMEPWEKGGDHRMISIKCGHLFGEKCFRTWLNMSTNPTCPTCKTDTCAEDIRQIYAKRVRLLDRTEEENLRKNLLSSEKQVATLQLKLNDLRKAYGESERKRLLYKKKLRKLEEKSKVSQSINNLDGRLAELIDSVTNSIEPSTSINDTNNDTNYKIYLNGNIQLHGDSGCRVMVYAKVHNSLFCSVKTDNRLFSSNGIRCIDMHTQRPTTLTHISSSKTIRDISINADDRVFAVTCLENNVRMYDTRTIRPALNLSNITENLWSCAYDCIDETNNIYLGGQYGHCFIFDMRSPTEIYLHFDTPGDTSPAINIAAVAKNFIFPQGGVIVCKLQSLWFFELTSCQSNFSATKLSLSGPFLSLRFDNEKQNLLLQTRATLNKTSQFIVAYLIKHNGEPMLNITCAYNAGTATPVMTRQAQINVPDNVLNIGYIQDINVVGLYDQRKMARIQSLAMADLIYDMCPMYHSNSISIAALTDQKLRIFKMEENTAI